MKEPKELLKTFWEITRSENTEMTLVEFMKQIQIDAYNEALDVAAKLVEERLKDEGQIRAYLIDGSSMLNLKKSISDAD